ncbi:E3 ubiquitin ligase PARAQUAT TOLERANCE 3 isoform X2 [Tripterygium wilfordii]|uniref:E3 ubiquitin ligase PARAQUAT TOLERANCE 3 isoform X2 n=1 Tax=Tripterygium wilfordii TaxID=458696 RepID=UPI0018F7EC49|nr:E3 ubiquitin ligase PARAQUAT TOLERANCE 3 isoform X2 [Tripterygium wilfordii]
MAVYYKFKSAKDYDSVTMDGPFISVGTLKEKIFESKHLGRGTDFDLVVTNAQTNEEYLDEAMLIPKNTSVLIRRVPGRPRMPIVTQQEPKVETKMEDTQPVKSSIPFADASVTKYTEDVEWDEFGHDLYAIPEAPPIQASNPLIDAPPTNNADEDSKLKALIETPALDWQRQGVDGFGGPGRGYGRGMAGRMGGRGFGFERKKPPEGYVCHRCKTPGHFIQHCPTNGDPNYDVKRVRPPTGIPKSMLIATPDGSYALPSGAVAVLKPNEAVFEKEIEGLPSTRPVGDLPPEMHCPMCNEVMKDAVFTSKCCFSSFCDKCIRDHIISKSRCICGATDVLADDLLPNKTVRDTINRILENGGNSSAENAGSAFQVQDMESKIPQPRIPSPIHSVGSKGEEKPPCRKEETPIVKEMVDEVKPLNAHPRVLEQVRTVKVADISEATLESMSIKEPASQRSAPPVEEEVQQKLTSGEAGKKKKKKKVRNPSNDLQWRTSQDLAADPYMMPLGPSAYNPYWNGMQLGMEGYMGPYAGGIPYMGPSAYNPYLDMPFGGIMPPDPFGAQGFMMPVVPPQRDLAEFGMGMNVAPPVMSREEFEARKADVKRRRENGRHDEREFSSGRNFNREVGGVDDGSSMKSKSKTLPWSSGGDPHHRRSERPSPDLSARGCLEPPPLPLKRKSIEHHDSNRDRDRGRDDARKDGASDRRHHHQPRSSEPKPTHTESAAAAAAAAADRKQKASVFSRISFPEGEAAKKRKHSSSSDIAAASGANASNHKSSAAYEDYKASKAVALASSAGGRKNTSVATADYESSDDERHFKRKPSRYEPSPPPPEEWEDRARHSKGSGDRERRHR